MPFRAALPKIYPLTDVSAGGGGRGRMSHAEQFTKLVEGGATMIQLREKNAPPREFYESAREVLTLAREKNIKIIINDRADIAFALKAAGVHLGQDDLPPAAARRLLGDDAIIGFSTHNVRQAIDAVRTMPVNYIAVGPIFQTFTKRNPDAVVGLEGVRRAREAVGDFPLVAIGGITLENARMVFAAGADSVAVIGGLISEPDRIAEKMKRFLDL